MNLAVDIGNTAMKIAALYKGEIVELIRAENWDSKIVRDFFDKYLAFDSGIAVSVRESAIPLWINGYMNTQIVLFNHKTPCPIVNGYKTPHTLGLDRLVAAVGANNIYPDTNVLVFDCGTAITIDFVSASGVFEGGNITPGLSTRFRALNTFTDKLPLLEVSKEFPLLGKSTTDAIRAGVLNGALFEMDAYINRYQSLYPDIKVIFTGGDAIFFERKLKNTIFVVPNLVIHGLNRILEYNV